jgi:hypothetical protein
LSKKLVTAVVLVWGTALAANCGGGSDEPASGGSGGGGTSNGAGDSSGGTKAGSSNKAGTDAGGTTAGKGGTAGNGGTAGKGGTTSGGTTGEAGQGMGGEATAGSPGAAGMSAAGDTGAGGTPGAAGNDAGGAGGAGNGMCPATIDLYPGVVAKAICDKRVDCCMSDADQCMMDVGDALNGIFTDLVQSEMDGLTAANCDALEKCVTAIKAADCKNWPAELGDNYGIPVDEPACRHFIEPKVKPTDTCTDQYQCINGYCTGNQNMTCAGFIADGDSCAVGLCNTVTSYCDGTKKCAPKLADGQTCAADGDCQSRICDTGNTDKCIAPDPKNDCEFTPSGCSLVSAAPRGGLGWSLLAGFITLGVVARRRRRA